MSKDITMDLPHAGARRSSRRLAAAVSAVLLAAATAAPADPRGGVVTNGTASISTPEVGLTQIDQGSRSASIDWQSFDIGAQERVIFNQPSSTSVALNRILGQDPSQIHGSLSANGRVFLINPNGIIFGATSRINVGSLVASSLDVTAIDADRYEFGTNAARSGDIVNDGRITAADGGSVTLLGGSVLNNGLIVANYGSVNLGAGRAATLDFAGDGLVRFQVDAALLENSAADAVANSGEIVADGGQVLMTARQASDVISRAVNNSGVVRAARIDNSGGRIRLVGSGSVVNSGRLDAGGAGANSTGGEVQVLGDQVSLVSTSSIDVSGAVGGGSAFIGGGFAGADASLQNARHTDVAAGAVITADSRVNGDAGRVAVWSDGTTTFNGDILARALGHGNGGFVEVSGREHISVSGHASLLSAHGNAGTLLIDPGSILITDGPNTAPTGLMDQLYDDWVNDQLTQGGLIITTASSDNNAAQTLTVDSSASVAWSGVTLTLNAGAGVTIDGLLAGTAGGSLEINAGGGVDFNRTLSLDGGLTVNAGGDINQSAGMTIGGAASFTTGTGQSVLLDETGNTFDGTLSVAATSGSLGSVSLYDSGDLDLGALDVNGSLTVNAAEITQSAAFIVGGTADFAVSSGTPVNLLQPGNAFSGAVSFNSRTGGSTGGVNLSNSIATEFGASSIAGSLVATSLTGGFTQSGRLSVSSAVDLTAGNNASITLGNPNNAFGGALLLSSSGTLIDVTVHDDTQLNLGALTISGDLVASSDAGIVQSGNFIVGDDATFTAGNGQSITLAGTGNAFNGDVQFAAAVGALQNVSIYDSNALELRALTVSGDLSVNAGGITQSGALNVGGDATFTAANGQSITMDLPGNAFAGDIDFAVRSGVLGSVSIRDATALELGPLTLSGSLTAVSGGALTQSGPLSIGTASTFRAANGQSITLGNTGNVFNGIVTLGAISGTLLDVTIYDSTALDLQALALSGDLSAASAMSLTQSGGLNIDGSSLFRAAAGSSILLLEPANDFSGQVRFSAVGAGNLQDVSVRSSTALDLGTFTLLGALTVNAGSVSQSGALNVGLGSSFTAAGGQDIILGNANNVFTGAVTLGAASGTLRDVNIADSTALTLQALTVGRDLTVRSTGSLNQSGSLNVGRNASFTAGAGQSITLADPNNAFTGTVALASTGPGALANVSISDSTALDMQALAVSGNLTVAASSITQSGALSVGQASSFTAAGGQSIELDETGNVFTGAVAIAASGAGNLVDVTLVDSTALQLPGMTLSGNLTARSGAGLTQAAALNIGGNSMFIAGTGQVITLNTPTNAFAGTVNFAAAGPGNLFGVTFTDSTALDLRALTLDGALNVTAGGAITQSGVLSVGTDASFRTLNDAGAAITLGGANAFGTVAAAVRNGADSADASAAIEIHESNGTTLRNVQTAGTVAVTSAGSIVSAATTGVTASMLSLVATNDIDVSSPGDVHVADVRAGGSVTLTSTGGSILDDNVDGAGSRIVGNALSLQAAGAIGEAAGTGNGTLDLQVTAMSANAQGGGLHVEQAAGDLNLRQLSAAGPISIRADQGSLVDDPNDASAASIVSTSGGIQLHAMNNIGTVTDLSTRQGTALIVNTNGQSLGAQVSSVTGQVNIAIASGSGVTAGTGAIAAGGDGRLLLQSAGDLAFVTFNDAITGFSQVGISSDGTLTLPDAPGGIDTGTGSTLLIRGATDVVRTGRVFDFTAGRLVFQSGGAGGDVTLNTSVNSLEAGIGNGASLSVVQAGTLTLGALAAGGDISVQAGGIVDDGDSNGVTRLTAGGAITLHSGGGIGAADGSGSGRIETSSQSVSATADAGSIHIAHQGDAQLSGSATGGSFDFTATGAVNVGAMLSATDALVLTAGGALGDAGDGATHVAARDAVLAAAQVGTPINSFNVDLASLSANAPGGVYVNAANALQLRAISGNFVAIVAAGAISDDGDPQTRVLASTATLSGTSIGTVVDGLDTSVAQLTANATDGGIYIDQSGDIHLGAVSAASANSGTPTNVTVVASGAITDDGDATTRIAGSNVLLSGTVVGASGAGAIGTQAVALSATASSGGIFINEADDLQLNAVIAANHVVVAAGGALTDDGIDSTRISGANVALSATVIGATNNRVDTSSDFLTAVASNGGVHIDESDGVTLVDVRSSGTGNMVNLRTGGNGNIAVQNLVTQGGSVNLVAGGTGSLNVTGTLESNNGVVTLTSGDLLAVPGLNTGTGSATLHTVNDVNVGTITAGLISIISDTGSVRLGTANAGTGTVSITAANGVISDDTTTSITAGQATLTARSIGSSDNPLNIAVGELAANATAGGIFIEDSLDLTAAGVMANGLVSLATSGRFSQVGDIVSGGGAISVFARNIDMTPVAATRSGGGNITYVATDDDASISLLDAGTGRVLVIAADNVFSAMAATSKSDNLVGSMVELRAGGLAGPGSGQIGGTKSLYISTPTNAGRNVFLIVPAENGIQKATPNINYPGASSTAVLLKGYTGTTGALLFDRASSFTPDTILLNGESIVPLANGRVAVNTDSLGAAKQALSSGVIARVNVDWAAFDPNVSLFGTLDPSLRLPQDQLDDAVPTASLFP